MGSVFIVILVVIVSIAFIFIIRLFGAWMLRIDEVIDVLQAILKELKAGDGSIESKARQYDAIEEFKKKLQQGK